jgi:hypothetical protein
MAESLLAMRDIVEANNPEIFDNPGDLQWVNQKLLQLKQAYETLLDSIGGGE